MLVYYEKSHEKMAMGLLSFMLSEKRIKYLKRSIESYESNPNWHLYLWKEREEIVGVIGIKIKDNREVIIQHISVNPSFRNLGVGSNMVKEIRLLYGEKYMISSNYLTRSFLKKCISEDKSDD